MCQHQNPRFYAVVLGASITLLLAACNKSENAPAAAPKTNTGPESISISVAAAQKQFLTIEAVGTSQDIDVLALPGRVTFRPQAQSAVGAATAGRVAQVLARAGEVVKAGTPLLTIDSADASAARATLDVSATRLATAESVYKRQVEMMEKGVGLEIERQEADARLKEARAEHERARQSVSLIGAGQGNRVTVRAPADGVVLSIRAAVGAMVGPGGDPLVELGDPSRLQVVAQVLEGDVRRVTVGQEAEVELPALALRVPARLETFNSRVDAESRRAQAYLSLSKPVEGLRAGMLAQIALKVGSDAHIAVPVSAVLIKDGKHRIVYVEKADGNFEARHVRTGHTQSGLVVILQGLTPGERVVVRGALLLDSQAEQLL